VRRQEPSSDDPSRFQTIMRVLFVLPPAKTSHEVETYREIPGGQVVVLGDSSTQSVDIALKVRRLPWVGAPERWAAAIAWYRGLGTVNLSDIDIVASMEMYSATSVQAIGLAQRLHVPHVVLVAEILDANPLYQLPPWRLWTAQVVKSLHAAICLTEAGRRHAVSRGVPAGRTVVVAPGVDTKVFRPASVRQPRPIVVYVGELRLDKGIREVISACDLVATRAGPHFRLTVVGDGPLQHEVEEATHSRSWLDLRGRIPRDQVPSTLQNSAAFALAPSSRRFWAEQFGYASVEAMACGLPVVATRSGAIPDVVPSYNPLVNEHDVNGLADGITRSLGAEGVDWGNQNREFACAHYDIRTQGAALGDALRSIVSRARRP